MILLSFDFETTGLDRQKDRITELGAVLWTTGFHRPLEVQSFFVKTDVPVTKEITDLTGITSKMIEKFGVDEDWAVGELIRMMSVADACIGQNIKAFDKEFFQNAAARHGMAVHEKLYIDTCTDLPGVPKKTLTLMAAEAKDPVTGRHCGFVNPFPHSALSDAMTVLQLVSLHNIDVVVARAKEPDVILQSLQKFDDNSAAKRRGFGFKSGLGKRWLQVVKQSDVDKIASEAPFDVTIVTDLTVQQVWYS